ncbi:MAG: GAF domain-containing protein, partial [Chloroflexota bacterium]|nr:GAF domain-containing protein [Chloroflexota bacterium]
MPESDALFETDTSQDRLLTTLERLLTLGATEVRDTLDQASQLVAEALRADKVDVFVHDPSKDTLVARGTSDTPMGRHQQQIGLDWLPVANGGRTVFVFQTGTPYRTGQADQDPDELIGVKQALGIRSTIAVPLDVNGQRRGVLLANSAEPERFTEADLHFLQAVARWIGMIMHRAELVEQITRDAAEQARRVAADEMITILAHDLRAPLAPLQGRIEMLGLRAEREGRQRDVA